MPRSLQGHLLVASPTLLDPNFARTVVAVANHDEEGALGLVLNRPSDTEVAEAVPLLAELVDEDEVVMVGGPVQPGAVVVLADFDEPDTAAFGVVDGIGFVGEGTDLERLPELAERARVFAGYAGWGPGQLEGEVEREDWIVVPTTAEDVFTDDPDGLWARVLERQGGPYRLLSRMPLDPTVN